MASKKVICGHHRALKNSSESTVGAYNPIALGPALLVQLYKLKKLNSGVEKVTISRKNSACGKFFGSLIAEAAKSLWNKQLEIVYQDVNTDSQTPTKLHTSCLDFRIDSRCAKEQVVLRAAGCNAWAQLFIAKICHWSLKELVFQAHTDCAYEKAYLAPEERNKGLFALKMGRMAKNLWPTANIKALLLDTESGEETELTL